MTVIPTSASARWRAETSDSPSADLRALSDADLFADEDTFSGQRDGDSAAFLSALVQAGGLAAPLKPPAFDTRPHTAPRDQRLAPLSGPQSHRLPVLDSAQRRSGTTAAPDRTGSPDRRPEAATHRPAGTAHRPADSTASASGTRTAPAQQGGAATVADASKRPAATAGAAATPGEATAQAPTLGTVTGTAPTTTDGATAASTPLVATTGTLGSAAAQAASAPTVAIDTVAGDLGISSTAEATAGLTTTGPATVATTTTTTTGAGAAAVADPADPAQGPAQGTALPASGVPVATGATSTAPPGQVPATDATTASTAPTAGSLAGAAGAAGAATAATAAGTQRPTTNASTPGPVTGDAAAAGHTGAGASETAGALGATPASVTTTTSTSAASATSAGSASTADAQKVVDQVMKHLVAARTLRDGTQRTVLHLAPDHLGAVTVTVDVRGGSVRLDMLAKDAAFAALREGLGDLRKQLTDAGLDLADVQLRDRNTSGDTGGQRRDDARDPWTATREQDASASAGQGGRERPGPSTAIGADGTRPRPNAAGAAGAVPGDHLDRTPPGARTAELAHHPLDVLA